MKILLLLRHAKSCWENPTLEDHDRPLNARGLKTAPLMGRLALEKKLIPDVILSSPAKRAQETAKLFLHQANDKITIQTIDAFYPGSPADFLTALLTQDDSASCVMIVGHNPGLELFLRHMTGNDQQLPTGSLSVIHLPIRHWNELTNSVAGKLVKIYRPRDLFTNLTE